MSDIEVEFNPVQVSTFIHGDQYVFRGRDVDHLDSTVAELEEKIDGITDRLNNIKQAVVAKAIFTGDSSKKGGTKAADVGSGNGGAPTCRHGVMKDLRHKNYKSDYYCVSDDRNDQCKPVKL